MPELRLIGDLKTVEVDFYQTVTGSTNDWLNMAQAIKDNWDEAAGFIIWAPEKSLLQLAGTASLACSGLGKPVVVFSSPRPGSLNQKKFEQLGIKSIILNASYVAASDLAEVLVLEGQNLYRVPTCLWGGKGSIKSFAKPLASVDFSLQIHLPFFKRQKSEPDNTRLTFSQNFKVLPWSPSLSEPVFEKDEQVLVLVDSAYWPSDDLQSLRGKLKKNKISTIWHSPEPFEEENWSGNELGISHSSQWWAILLSQIALGSFTNQKQAFAFIEKNLGL